MHANKHPVSSKNMLKKQSMASASHQYGQGEKKSREFVMDAQYLDDSQEESEQISENAVPKLGNEFSRLKLNLQPGEGIRNALTEHVAADDQMKLQCDLLQRFTASLHGMLQESSREMHMVQFEQVKGIIERAYTNSESNSLLLLSRSRQVVHSFLS